VLRKTAVALLVALPLGIAAPAAAQTDPGPTPTATPSPDATKRALLAYGLLVADARYEIGGSAGADGTVAITLFGPPRPEMLEQIAAVVWAAEPLQFDQVVVRWSGGETARSAVDLQAALGPRPEASGRQSVTVAMLGAGLTNMFIGLDEAARQLLETVTWVLKMVVIGLAVLIALFVVLGNRTSGRRDRAEYRSWQ
jgi:hypothetical protein